MRRRTILPLLLAALTFLAPGCDPDPGGSTSTTWEWMFRGTAAAGQWGNPLMRRHCEILWTFDGTNPPSGNDLKAANDAAVADMERLTDVNIDYFGTRASASDLVMAANFPIEVSWESYGANGVRAWSMPIYSGVSMPKDLIGGFVGYNRQRAIDQPTLTEMAKHEWAHQFNVGDTYNTTRSMRYDATQDATFDQVMATNQAYLDTSQRMGDTQNPWGSGDKEGLWEAGARSRGEDCLRLIRASTGAKAWRMHRALYGAPDFERLGWYEVLVRNDSVQAAADMIALPEGAGWRAKTRDDFIVDAWTALTGSAPDAQQLAWYQAMWTNDGRAAVFSDMASTADSRTYMPKTQAITLIFANVIQRVPTSAEITQFADKPYVELRDHLYYDTNAGQTLYNP